MKGKPLIHLILLFTVMFSSGISLYWSSEPFWTGARLFVFFGSIICIANRLREIYKTPEKVKTKK